jgi:NF-X1-type zinc finger protein NFXL1
LHLSCIQRWANDSIIQKRISQENQPDGFYTSTGNYVAKKEISITWDCPQCRTNYEVNEIPKHYECYCGKEINPQYQPFLIPHSCGEICHKDLNPKCGHSCLMLCHPGSHASCAQIIEKSCNCLKSPVKTIRCSQQNWSCDKKCEKLLDCGVHKCEDICHSICLPCQKSRLSPCACGSSSKEIKCKNKSWSCGAVCAKKLTCNVHFCEQKCHSGDCQNCIFGLGRTCFCGKQTKESAQNCETFVKESCGQTCSKPLMCGRPDHKCMSRCHKNECGQCLVSLKIYVSGFRY